MDIQSWFFGKGSQVDPRIVKMKDEGSPFRPGDIIDPSILIPLSKPHPKFVKEWVENRRAGK